MQNKIRVTIQTSIGYERIKIWLFRMKSNVLKKRNGKNIGACATTATTEEQKRETKRLYTRKLFNYTILTHKSGRGYGI